MAKIKYVLIGFGGIAENRVAKEGFACDKRRFKPLKNAVLVGAMDLNPARQKAAEALGLKWYGDLKSVLADKDVDGVWTSGRFDRVVFTGGNAVIYDFKTNARGLKEDEAAFARRMAETYAGQMRSYRKALGALTGLAAADISAVLLLSATGAAVPVD